MKNITETHQLWKAGQTDLDAIKKVAASLLYEDVIADEHFPFVAYHPFFESIYLPYENRMVNILENKKALMEIRKKREERIWKTNDVELFFGLLTKPFRLLFLKETKEFMSKRDFSVSLKTAWTLCEDPNQDFYVDVDTVISWFYEAEQKDLMSKEEFVVFQNLPEKIRVYRGVAVHRNPDGISWTHDLKIAQWFAQRFDSYDQKGYVRTGMIDKKHILAYFDDQEEKEIVVDRNYLTDI